MKKSSSLLLPSFHCASGVAWEEEQILRINDLALKYNVNIIDYPLQKTKSDQSVVKKLEDMFFTYIPNGYIIKPDYGSQVLIDLRRYKINIDKLISLDSSKVDFWDRIEDIKNSILKLYPRVIKSNDEWKELLTQEQYQVCREKGTEKAFSGKYYKLNKNGNYHCICCDNKLFSSSKKFDSKTGWPSFSDGYKNSINIKKDISHNMTRQEALCAVCDSHLGHLFADSRSKSGQRYCINSVSLTFRGTPK